MSLQIVLYIVVGTALLIYGLWGIYRRQIGWSIGPLMTTTITGVPGALFSVGCALGGGLMAVPLLVAIVSDQARDTLFIQIATYIGMPVVVTGLILAVLVQLAQDLGQFIARLRDRPES